MTTSRSVLPQSPPHPSTPRWHVPEAVAAWTVPGLGHWLLGQKTRGVILGSSIGLLWLMGILIGGISVCDRKEVKLWFLGQALVAPTLGVDYYQQRLKQPPTHHPPKPDRPHLYEPSYGRMNEQGVLYVALAGLLNLYVMIDVIYCDPSARLAADTTHDQTTHTSRQP